MAKDSQSIYAEVLTLQTPRGRLLFAALATGAVFVAPYKWLAHLSLWGALGWHSAPSIGLTRAYWLFLHGQPAAAWQRNKLIYLVLVVALPLLAYDLYLWLTKNHHKPSGDE